MRQPGTVWTCSACGCYVDEEGCGVCPACTPADRLWDIDAFERKLLRGARLAAVVMWLFFAAIVAALILWAVGW